MVVSKNSVEHGKAIWGKLDVIRGFLVYTIGVLANDNIFHKAMIDDGNGEHYMSLMDFQKIIGNILMMNLIKNGKIIV